MAGEMDLSVWEKRLLKVLRDISPKEYRKLLRKAGNLLRKNVRRATAKKDGDLRKSYRIKVKPREESVLVYTNKFYAKMVEEGHPIVKYTRTKKGRRVQRTKHVLGFVPGKFYFRKGFEQTEKELPGLLKDFMRTLAREMGLDVSG